MRFATQVPNISRRMRRTKEPSKLKSIPNGGLNSDQSVPSEARRLRMKGQGPVGGEVVKAEVEAEVESVPWADES